jgi:DNA-binding protein YbaB
MSQRSVEGSDAGSGGVRGVGEADEGRVRVTVVDDRLETVRVEPRLLRSSPERVSPLLIEAVNAALEDFRARGSGEIPDFDLLEIAGDLQKANEQFERDMHRTMADAAQTIAELRRAGVRVGDLPTMDFGDMVGELTDALRKVSEGQNAGEEELTGTGEAPRGAVRAVCASGGRLDSLTLDSRTLRGTVELERDVVTAVNAALDDLAAKTRERQAASKVDPEEMKKQLGQLRERNVARLESYYRAVSDVIGGIEPQR